MTGCPLTSGHKVESANHTPILRRDKREPTLPEDYKSLANLVTLRFKLSLSEESDLGL